ncbi:EKC KEOPS complex subunit TPRKB [Babesia caballi]|uniref:EKC KEOPS complex subunit TPRKB n=1 Tax=Babesia caballi TaxID=5871 RepID=A0AAV4M2X2_BABCB|nr:EKC KEOPS complex subunit TPRKB [Babesia caballi]
MEELCVQTSRTDNKCKAMLTVSISTIKSFGDLDMLVQGIQLPIEKLADMTNHERIAKVPQRELQLEAGRAHLVQALDHVLDVRAVERVDELAVVEVEPGGLRLAGEGHVGGAVDGAEGPPAAVGHAVGENHVAVAVAHAVQKVAVEGAAAGRLHDALAVGEEAVVEGLEDLLGLAVERLVVGGGVDHLAQAGADVERADVLAAAGELEEDLGDDQVVVPPEALDGDHAVGLLLAHFDGDGALAVADASVPLAFEGDEIVVDELAAAVQHVAVELADVDAAVGLDHAADAAELVVAEVADLDGAVHLGELAAAVVLAVLEVAFVLVATGVDQLALAVEGVVVELAGVDEERGLELAAALSFVVGPLAVVLVALLAGGEGADAVAVAV